MTVVSLEMSDEPKILQQPFGILLFEISNDNSFGFDIYFLEKDFLALDSAKDFLLGYEIL